MNLSVLQENLSRGLSIVRSGIGKDSNLPILQTILFTATKNGLLLQATNLDIGVQCLVRGKVEKEGSFTLDSKTIIEYISLLPKEKVTITLTGENIVHITCGNFSTKLRGMSSDEFPLLPSHIKEKSCSYEIGDFRDALSNVLFTVQYNEARPELSGVYCKILQNQHHVAFVGTDAYRLSETLCPVREKPLFEEGVIIPLKTLQELSRILQNSISGIVEMSVAEHQIVFYLNDVEMYSRRIQGIYPDYQAIIPSSFITECTFEKNECINALKAAALFSRKGLSEVKLTIQSKENSKGTLTLYASNETLGENSTSLESEVRGSENEITINYRYLLDALQVMKEDRCVLKLIDSSSPCYVGQLGVSHFQHIIMPIKQ